MGRCTHAQPAADTAERQWPNKLVRPTKSLTEEPDDLSGKRPTKTEVLVVYRTRVFLSGALSLIAKGTGFYSLRRIDEAPSAEQDQLTTP